VRAGLARTEWALTAVQAWLAAHGTEPAAATVLTGLVERVDLGRTEWALTAVQAWLAAHGSEPSALDLRRILQRTDLV
jgi:hypothetical protein